MVKTTLEIPDGTFRRAKTRAAEKGLSFRQFATQALEEKLQRMEQTRGKGEPEWMRLFGALGQTPALRAETCRIQREIDEEFERIETEEA